MSNLSRVSDDDLFAGLPPTPGTPAPGRGVSVVELPDDALFAGLPPLNGISDDQLFSGLTPPAPAQANGYFYNPTNPITDIRTSNYRTPLDPNSEFAFKSWYTDYAQQNGLDPNPDDPLHQYDYRGYWDANRKDPKRYFPSVDPEDGRMHLPSEFKDDDHPNRYVTENGQVWDTKLDKPAEVPAIRALLKSTPINPEIAQLDLSKVQPKAMTFGVAPGDQVGRTVKEQGQPGTQMDPLFVRGVTGVLQGGVGLAGQVGSLVEMAGTLQTMGDPNKKAGALLKYVGEGLREKGSKTSKELGEALGPTGGTVLWGEGEEAVKTEDVVQSLGQWVVPLAALPLATEALAPALYEGAVAPAAAVLRGTTVGRRVGFMLERIFPRLSVKMGAREVEQLTLGASTSTRAAEGALRNIDPVLNLVATGVSSALINATFTSTAQFEKAKGEGKSDQEAMGEASVAGGLGLAVGLAAVSRLIPGNKLPVRVLTGMVRGGLENGYRDLTGRVASGEEITFDKQAQLAALSGIIMEGAMSGVRSGGAQRGDVEPRRPNAGMENAEVVAESQAKAAVLLAKHNGDFEAAVRDPEMPSSPQAPSPSPASAAEPAPAGEPGSAQDPGQAPVELVPVVQAWLKAKAAERRPIEEAAQEQKAQVVQRKLDRQARSEARAVASAQRKEEREKQQVTFTSDQEYTDWLDRGVEAGRDPARLAKLNPTQLVREVLAGELVQRGVPIGEGRKLPREEQEAAKAILDEVAAQGRVTPKEAGRILLAVQEGTPLTDEAAAHEEVAQVVNLVSAGLGIKGVMALPVPARAAADEVAIAFEAGDTGYWDKADALEADFGLRHDAPSGKFVSQEAAAAPPAEPALAPETPEEPTKITGEQRRNLISRIRGAGEEVKPFIAENFPGKSAWTITPGEYSRALGMLKPAQTVERPPRKGKQRITLPDGYEPPAVDVRGKRVEVRHDDGRPLDPEVAEALSFQGFRQGKNNVWMAQADEARVAFARQLEQGAPVSYLVRQPTLAQWLKEQGGVKPSEAYQAATSNRQQAVHRRMGVVMADGVEPATLLARLNETYPAANITTPEELLAALKSKEQMESYLVRGGKPRVLPPAPPAPAPVAEIEAAPKEIPGQLSVLPAGSGESLRGAGEPGGGGDPAAVQEASRPVPAALELKAPEAKEPPAVKPALQDQALGIDLPKREVPTTTIAAGKEDQGLSGLALDQAATAEAQAQSQQPLALERPPAGPAAPVPAPAAPVAPASPAPALLEIRFRDDRQQGRFYLELPQTPGQLGKEVVKRLADAGFKHNRNTQVWSVKPAEDPALRAQQQAIGEELSGQRLTPVNIQAAERRPSKLSLAQVIGKLSPANVERIQGIVGESDDPQVRSRFKRMVEDAGGKGGGVSLEDVLGEALADADQGAVLRAHGIIADTPDDVERLAEVLSDYDEANRRIPVGEAAREQEARQAEAAAAERINPEDLRKVQLEVEGKKHSVLLSPENAARWDEAEAAYREGMEYANRQPEQDKRKVVKALQVEWAGEKRKIAGIFNQAELEAQAKARQGLEQEPAPFGEEGKPEVAGPITRHADGTMTIADFGQITPKQYGQVGQIMRKRGFDWRDPADVRAIMERSYGRPIAPTGMGDEDLVAALTQVFFQGRGMVPGGEVRQGLPLFQPVNPFQMSLRLEERKKDVASGKVDQQIELAGADTPIAKNKRPTEIVARTIKAQEQATGYATIRNIPLLTRQSMAEAAQVVRDPYAEHLRLVFFDLETGAAISVEHYASKSPDAVGDPLEAGWDGKGDRQVYMQKQLDALKERVAKMQEGGRKVGLWLLHNHPTGAATPSQADLSMTQSWRNRWQEMGVEYKGHVIINSGEYAVIEDWNRATLYDLDTHEKIADISSFFLGMQVEPAKGVDLENLRRLKAQQDPLLNLEGSPAYDQMALNDPNRLVDFGVSLKKPENTLTVMFLSNNWRVRGAVAYPVEMANNKPEFTKWLADRRREYGASQIAVYQDGDGPSLLGYGDELIKGGHISILMQMTGMDPYGKPEAQYVYPQRARPLSAVQRGDGRVPVMRVAQPVAEFGEGDQRLVKAEEPKITHTLDTAVADPEREYRGAGRVENGELVTYHASRDPAKVVEAISRREDVSKWGNEFDDLRQGLYASDAPGYWKGRDTSRLEYLEHLTPKQTEALAKEVERRLEEAKKVNYISTGEYGYGQRAVEALREGNNYIQTLVGQPWNIPLGSKEFIQSIGATPTEQGGLVELRLKGKFAELKVPNLTAGEQLWLQQQGYDGAYTPAGFSSQPQLVLWNSQAVQSAKPARIMPDTGRVLTEDQLAAPNILEQEPGPFGNGEVIPDPELSEGKDPVPIRDAERQKDYQGAFGIPEVPYIKTVGEWATNQWNKIFRELQYLPKDPVYEPFRYAINRLSGQRGAANIFAYGDLQNIAQGLSKYDRSLFYKAVYFDDQGFMADSRDEEYKFPGSDVRAAERAGISVREYVQGERDYFNELAAKSPGVQAAMKARAEAWEIVRTEFMESAKKAGFNVDDSFNNPVYYRHQILKYAQEKGVPIGTRIREPSKSAGGVTTRRLGSSEEHNTNYLDAEFEALSNLNYGTFKNGVLAEARALSVYDDLTKQAKDHNATVMEGVWPAMAEAYNAANPDLKPIDAEGAKADFTRKQGMAAGQFRSLAEAGALPSGNGQWSNFLNALELGADSQVEGENLIAYAGWVLNQNAALRRARLEAQATYTPGSPQQQKAQERIFDILQSLDGMEGNGVAEAALLFKGVSEKKEFTEGVLRQMDQFRTWQDFMNKDTHREWYPEKDRSLFSIAYTIPERAAEEFLLGELADLSGIPRDKIQKVVYKAGKAPAFIIPNEVADTLDAMEGRMKGPNVLAGLQKPWKTSVLIGPTRLAKYTLRNGTGDAEAMFLGNRRAFTKVPQAARELWQAQVMGKVPARGSLLRIYIAQGGLASDLAQAEMGEVGDIRRLKEDFDLRELGRMRRYMKNAALPFTGYFKVARIGNDYREAILKYAAFIQFREEMLANGGKPKSWGASDRRRIMGLKTVDQRAFQMANDLLGAYDEVGHMGQWLRNYAMPFYSWEEVNTRRYKRLLQNAMEDAGVAEAAGIGWLDRLRATGRVRGQRAALRAVTLPARYLVRLGLLGMAMMGAWMGQALWNHYGRALMPGVNGDDPNDDPERDLELYNPQIAYAPHVTLGRDSEGKVIVFTRTGILTSMLEWVGADRYPRLLQRYLSGKASGLDTMKRYVFTLGLDDRRPPGQGELLMVDRAWMDLKEGPSRLEQGFEARAALRPGGAAAERNYALGQILMGPTQKVVNMIGPLPGKLLAEEAFGVSSYPDITRPKPIPDRFEYLLKTFGQEYVDLYRKLPGVDVPHKEFDPKNLEAWLKALGDLLIYRVDVKESAYWAAYNLQAEYMRAIGKGREGRFWSENNQNLADIKATMRYNQPELTEKFLQQYLAGGGTIQGVRESIAKMEPLSLIPSDQRQKFADSLTPDEKRTVTQALKYYEETLLDDGGFEEMFTKYTDLFLKAGSSNKETVRREVARYQGMAMALRGQKRFDEAAGAEALVDALIERGGGKVKFYRDMKPYYTVKAGKRHRRSEAEDFKANTRRYFRAYHDQFSQHPIVGMPWTEEERAGAQKFDMSGEPLEPMPYVKGAGAGVGE